MRPEVLAGIGGFGAMVELPLDRYRRPVLVSGTDGVGTKLGLPSRPAGMTPSASTWSPCAPTTSWSRAPNRCIFWTTTPPGD